MKKFLTAIALALLVTGQSFAYDCSTDCGKAAEFRYPCPTFRNPGRKCTGRDPGTYAACETAKAASCKLFSEIKNAVEGEVRHLLEPNFNRHTFAAAVERDKEAEYQAKCQAAGIAVCAALGAKFGGPWGAALGGAGGVFISYQLCEQSTKW